MKAVNVVETDVREVTLAIDVAAAEQQVSRITDVLQNQQLALTPAERRALTAARQMLAAASDTEIPEPAETYSRIKAHDINLIRDLHMCGHTASYLADKFNYRPLAVQRLLRGDTYRGTPYEPTSFCPPNVEKMLPDYPWGESDD